MPFKLALFQAQIVKESHSTSGLPERLFLSFRRIEPELECLANQHEFTLDLLEEESKTP